ncbi:hypothetical protein QO021_30330 (plasmid) [Pseudomonas amygdali pv. lachrymans]|uniref:hypothetical protein n=1 Tax=Pseudomonas amygdali TaxID=47877 RepID=UPI0006B8D152|nr:hypothetical protein [Pseudomonas amygdali]RMM39340.1 hypothetical protein ALQ79_200141 [Pseudomonas amygdali pv. lachrymans]WIO61386.1 hypothetical protein QO021_30330 [Pseudomonas amygdali pv. lachrymans]
MAWITAKDRLPPAGTTVLCRLRHWKTKRVIDERLTRVDEGDCTWRTDGDGCEISHNWDVIEWEEQS